EPHRDRGSGRPRNERHLHRDPAVGPPGRHAGGRDRTTTAPAGDRRAMMAPMTATRDPGALLSASRVKLGEFEYEIGPLGHLAAERERLQQLTWRAFDATPVGSTIGAEIDGVALGDSAVMWDNRAVQHYVCSDYWPSVR